MLLILAFIVILALVYEFGNGMNDAANAVATIVATKAISLRKALFLSALGNFVGPFLLGVAVAETIGKGIITLQTITPLQIASVLLSAIFWIYLATHKGLPISVTHSVIGGLIGIGLVTNVNAIVFDKVLVVLLFIFIAPIIGFITAFLLELTLIYALKHGSKRWNTAFRKLQIITSFLFNVGHGANDSQNGMGIIAMTLFVLGGTAQFEVPLWVILACATSISIGTYVGGVRVIRTSAMKITELKPYAGFIAEGAGAFTLFYSTLLGIPVSSSHIMGGAIAGSGAPKGLAKVRWRNMRKIVASWIVTIPLTAMVSAFILLVFTLA